MKTKFFLPTLLLMLFTWITSGVKGQHPTIGGFNVYYGSLHNHTGASDGNGTAAAAYAYARNTARLDFFGLADHSNMLSSSEWTTIKSAANSANADGFFTAFYGFEWTTFFSYGHVAVINTDDFLTGGNFSQLISWINARNGIAFFNHPGWDPFAFQEFSHFSGTPTEKFVGMELWNDHDGFVKYYYNDGYYSNDGGKGYFDEALSRGWKIGAAGSDDNHTSTWGTATDYRVGVLSNNLTRTDILNAFVARRFFATLDKNLALSFKINGSEMGSTIAPGTWNAEIQASDGNGDIFIQAELLKNGSVINSWLGSSSSVYFPVTISCNNGDYFYIRVKQLDQDEAISSPIFIKLVVNQPPVVQITNPKSGAQFILGDQITIDANASDADGTISKVEFYNGNALANTDITSPYSYSYIGDKTGTFILTAKAYDNSGGVTTSSPVTIQVNPLTQVGSLQSGILSGSDDAEEYKSGNVYLNRGDLNLVYESRTSGNQTVGLRFTALAIPQGATITKAVIRFTASGATSGKCALVIRGQATDDAATFETGIKNLSGRLKTIASVSWSPASWSGGTYDSPDIKTVIQEIVNRAGWLNGKSVAILITGTGTRNALSYETGSSSAPQLLVDFTTIKSGNLNTGSQAFQAEEFLPVNNLTLFPNPVTDMLTIIFSTETQVSQIMIYSMTGSLVKALKFNKDLAEIQIDCNSLKPGTYLLTVQTNQGNRSTRFIKQ